jgi:hypothetical protein
MNASVRKSLLISGILFILATAGPAWAETVGIAVSAIGSSQTVGLAPLSNGAIPFYIPLTVGSSGDYGNKGTSADTCSYPSTCTGGSLKMFLMFDTPPVQVGENVLTLEFLDLDLKGVNDPAYFLESLRIYVAGGTILIDERTDMYVSSSTNSSSQLIVVPLKNVVSPFWIELEFKSKFKSSTPPGNYKNIKETIRATMISATSVPEPTSLSLLAISFVAIGLLSRRR